MHRGEDIESKKNPGYAEGTLQSVKGKNGRKWYVHYPSEDAQKSAGYWHNLTRSTYGIDTDKNQWWVLLKTRRPDPIDYSPGSYTGDGRFCLCSGIKSRERRLRRAVLLGLCPRPPPTPQDCWATPQQSGASATLFHSVVNGKMFSGRRCRREGS